MENFDNKKAVDWTDDTMKERFVLCIEMLHLHRIMTDQERIKMQDRLLKLTEKKEVGMRDETIRQAAQAYDMDYDTAKRIHDKDPGFFYENMEDYIKERAKTSSEGEMK